MAAWKLYSTSSARHRLRELVKRGMAEEIKFGNRVRYHIKVEMKSLNKEIFDVMKDIISGALPLWELPHFLFWLVRGK